jgi:hypothetical protein
MCMQNYIERALEKILFWKGWSLNSVWRENKGSSSEMGWVKEWTKCIPASLRHKAGERVGEDQLGDDNQSWKERNHSSWACFWQIPLCICYGHTNLGFEGGKLRIIIDMCLPDMFSDPARFIIASSSLSGVPQFLAYCTLISYQIIMFHQCPTKLTSDGW